MSTYKLAVLSPIKFIACLASCCVVIAPALPGQTGEKFEVKRLYVEPFAEKRGSAKLREDLIAQIRKLGSVSLAMDAASADATLSADGEIWIKGYRSLNPRSGRLPSDGTPVYTGFLSVELKDAKGQTLWSYLVTPDGASEDISKQLAKRIVKHLSEVLAPTSSGPAGASH